MLDNDKTIFKFLEPTSNEILSDISEKELKEILFYLDKYFLEYRDNLGLGSMDTYGIELEIEHFPKWGGFWFNEFYKQLKLVVGNDRWESRNDISLVKGREIVSDILTDNKEHWDNIRKVCDFVNVEGKIDVNCATHIHAGSQILGNKPLYWYRFFKLWSIYENVIYRFCYGEYLTYRPKIIEYARPSAMFFEERLKLVSDKLDCDLLEFLNMIEPKNVPERYTKKFGISYWRMLLDDNYRPYDNFDTVNKGCTFELRVPNGTLDEVIVQNYINLFIKMLNYCKSDNFNDDILNKRKIEVYDNFSKLDTYSNIYLGQSLEFSDMIFDNNTDKIYFLRQYLKSMEVADKPFVKAKKMTVTNR